MLGPERKQPIPRSNLKSTWRLAGHGKPYQLIVLQTQPFLASGGSFHLVSRIKICQESIGVQTYARIILIFTHIAKRDARDLGSAGATLCFVILRCSHVAYLHHHMRQIVSHKNYYGMRRTMSGKVKSTRVTLSFTKGSLRSPYRLEEKTLANVQICASTHLPE